MKDKMLKRTLCAIFILALFLRVFTVITQQEFKKIPHADASVYDHIAMNIASGHGLSLIMDDGFMAPTTHRTPLYPLFLAGIYILFGHSYIAVEVIQVFLGALFCMLIFFITNLLYSNMRINLIASIITALYKPFVSGFNYYGGPSYLLSEYFYMFILAITVLILILFLKKGSKVLGAASGILIGITVLTRPEFVLFPILLIFYLLYTAKFSLNQLIYKHFIIYLFILLTMMPWVARNYAVQGRFIPLSTFSGFLFWMGNNSEARGGWAYPKDYDAVMTKTQNLSEYEKNQIFFKEGFEELAANPKRIPKLFVKKVMVHWAPFEEGFRLFNLSYALVFLLGSVGILFCRKSAMEDILLILFASTTLIAITFWGDPRYRYPYEPYLIIFAAPVITKVLDTIIGKRA